MEMYIIKVPPCSKFSCFRRRKSIVPRNCQERKEWTKENIFRKRERLSKVSGTFQKSPFLIMTRNLKKTKRFSPHLLT